VYPAKFEYFAPTTHYFCGPGCLRKFQAALV